MNELREKLKSILGAKAENLAAELNYYHDIEKCGISFHGDAERKIVVCGKLKIFRKFFFYFLARLGHSLPMHFQWFYKLQPVGERVVFTLNHGDIYVNANLKKKTNKYKNKNKKFNLDHE